MRVLVGTSGYNYPAWKGPFYPPKLPASGMLSYYAERLPTVEINYTFYRMPNAKTIAGWSEATPPQFTFVLKAPKRITHDSRLKFVDKPLAYFCDTVATLEVRDGQVRLLANLDPIDSEVHAAGIGGPRLTPPAAPATPLLGRAGQVRVDLDAMIRRANLLAHSFLEAGDSLALHVDRLAATPSILPTAGWLSSAFSRMREHPILHLGRPHEGIDVSAPMGTPIEAPANGTIIQAGWEAGYGNTVVIDHGFGIVTKFAHASRLLVRVGARVRRGERIALVGNSGLSTGPHLHYEVHVNGRPVNPLRYVLPSVITD